VEVKEFTKYRVDTAVPAKPVDFSTEPVTVMTTRDTDSVPAALAAAGDRSDRGLHPGAEANAPPPAPPEVR
jgi:hypothetical protein